MPHISSLLNEGKAVEAMYLSAETVALGVSVPGLHYLHGLSMYHVGRYKEALVAFKAELAVDPAHPDALDKAEYLTKLLHRHEVKIPTQQRSWQTTLPRETMYSIQSGTMRYTYKGISMLKNPFDFALYPILLWNLQPRTIIEIGSKDGGSALWMRDMLDNFQVEGHIYSIDVVQVNSVQHPRVTFMEGNGRKLHETLDHVFLKGLPRPWLVIEDADHNYETSLHVLNFFHPYLQPGEYIVIEDGIISDLTQDASCSSGPHQALKAFLASHHDEYEIDATYCDYFGYNITWCTNGFLRKLK